jgi:hypothetical protein
MLVQRLRFTTETQKCVREDRQLSIVQRQNAAIKKKLGERLMDKDIPENERSTLNCLQIVIHEQNQIVAQLSELKTSEEKSAAWAECVRFYSDDKEGTIELKYGDLVIPIAFEYSPPTLLVSLDFTHTLRWAYLDCFGEGGSKLLVLIGATGSGKTGMLKNVGQLLGTMPTILRVSESSPCDEAFWNRRLAAADATGGGPLAPVIVTEAQRASAEVLALIVNCASKFKVALCMTMSHTPEAKRHQEGVLAGCTVITLPEPQLSVMAGGALAAEGLEHSDALAVPLGDILTSLRQNCSKQPHYDFGPRTLMQLCSQIGFDRNRRTEEKDTVASVVERVLLPRLAKQDVPILQGLIKEKFKTDKKLSSPSDCDSRWVKVADNIHTITLHEPDCMVLPVPPSDEAAFMEDFCKMLNKYGSSLVKLEGKLCDMTPEDLLGAMPQRGEPVKDGVLIDLLRKAMADHPDEGQIVWVAMNCGNITPDTWECLHELLNDSHCINLATGEQLRIAHNIRFLFIMPDAGATPQDTFSRAAIVFTDPV